MRRAIFSAILAFLFVVGTAASADAAQPPPQGCIINLLGIKVCGELLSPLPTVTVTVRPPPVRVTVNVPGPTRFITLPGQPGQTRTVTVPGPTTTRTVPGPSAGPSVGPTMAPTQQSQATKTVTVSPSGQPSPTRGTLGPGDTTEHEPFITLDTPSGVARTVGFGLLSLLALVAIVLLGMAYAFQVGRRSKEDEDTNFMREVLDSVKSRGRHS